MVFTSDQVLKCIIDSKGTAVPQQHGVDLTVDSISRIVPSCKEAKPSGVYKSGTILPRYEEIKTLDVSDDVKGWYLQPGIYSAYFEQGVKIPLNAKANIIHRSSMGRCGTTITSGEYDAGFETDQMGAILQVFVPIFIEKGARIAQLVVYETNKVVENTYHGHYQNEVKKNQNIQ